MGNVRILDGTTFVVCDRRGDIERVPAPTDPAGLFAVDTRFLSHWVLTIDEQRLQPLSVDDTTYYEAQFVLVPGSTTQYVDAPFSVLRRRWIGSSVHEQIEILNHRRDALDVTLRIDAAADFADIFGVKHLDRDQRPGRTYRSAADERLVLGYERDTWHRRTTITCDPAPTQVDEDGITYHVRIDPLGRWQTEVTIAIDVVSDGPAARIGRGSTRSKRNDLSLWLAQAPRVDCPWTPLTETYQRSLVDLAALRFRVGEYDLPAAGLPWFMTLFGRDSIITCLQTLPFAPSLTRATLRALAGMQGTRLDDFREEEPGKILHEVRYGESAAFGEQPQSPYYGAADTTPLFVILLDEYERWSGDAELVRHLEAPVRAALEWIDAHGDLAGDGYVRYRRRSPASTGLDNQCWKDSWDGICYADGRLPDPCRATCEIQGYAYDAKMRGARLARTFWNDPDFADRLEREAADLKARFNRDFWVEDGEYYALGLDSDGEQINALASNMGHCLWSGIIDPDRAPAVADHLLGPRLFSGWGVRTLAEGQGSYNPVGYHVGTVWPFDNSIIAWGLRRYGFREEAGRIAVAMFDAAPYFDGRLPEAFAGYSRSLIRHPVEYPTACSPQAWSTGTPLLLIRVLLGMDPIADRLVTDPRLPPAVSWLAVLDAPGRWGTADAYGRVRTGRTWRPGVGR